MYPLSLSRLFLFALRVSNLTFGGGEVTMAALYSEMVTGRRWMSADEGTTSYALSRITPGTNMLAFFAGTGWQLLGWPGALAAVMAASVPPAVIILVLTQSYEALRSHPHAMAAFTAILAAAVGMMASAVWSMLRPHLTRRRWPHAVVLGGGSIALAAAGVAPVPVIALAALIGVFWRVPE